jgi:hypothetical protein
MTHPPNARCRDLKQALDKGKFRNRNHLIKVSPEIVQQNAWCQTCPESMNCFLAGKTIDLDRALQKGYPCVSHQGYIFFSYHDSCVLTFARAPLRVNDWGYWGYSVTTSRSIRWYLDALAHHGFITPKSVEAAIEFFKKRRASAPSGDLTLEWFNVD